MNDKTWHWVVGARKLALLEPGGYGYLGIGRLVLRFERRVHESMCISICMGRTGRVLGIVEDRRWHEHILCHLYDYTHACLLLACLIVFPRGRRQQSVDVATFLAASSVSLHLWQYFHSMSWSRIHS